MTEAQQTRRLIERIKKKLPGAFVWKINDRTTAGIPDLVVIYHGATFWLECKRFGGIVSEIQKATMQTLENAGASVAVVWFGPEGVTLTNLRGELLPHAPLFDVLAGR